MKYQKVVIFSLVSIVIGAALYYVVSEKGVANQVSEQTTLQTQTLTDGAVIYKVIPKNLTTLATTWDFEINLDTHTGSLDQDLVAIVRLVDDKGNEYRSVKWEGAPPGGHHREGTLKFSAVTPRPTFIELNIQTTDSTKEANLRWNL